MVVFMDTSALAKRYIIEVGSDIVDLYFNESNDIFLAPITSIEMASIFRRREAEGSLSLADIEKSRRDWNKEYSSFRFGFFNSELVHASIVIIKKARIKSLDAIQLASAYLSQIDEFITADKALARAAETVLNEKVVLIS